MTPNPPSMLGRAVAAVALTVGFYALALTLAGLLIAGPIALWVSQGHGNAWLTLACAIAGVTILRAVVPARDRFEAPGPQLEPESQPELFVHLRSVAEAVGEPLPPAVYLDGDVNASVTEISNGLLRGRRRVMVLGLPLLASLTPAQTRAVVAHEFGHYIAGDTRFSAWIWRTRVAVLKTVHALDDEESWFQRIIVRTPFLLYAKLFLRLTNAISRRAEFAADAVAARVAGAPVHADTLRAITAAGPAYGGYWRDVAHALNHGRRPPIAAGFQRFLGDHEIRAQVDELVAAEIEEGETNPYDSHPTLADRLRAIGAAATGEISPPAPADSAAALLRDVERLEREVLETTFGRAAIADLEHIDWEQTGQLYAAEGDSLAERHGAAYAGLTVGDAAVAAQPPSASLAALREQLGEEARDVPDDELLGYWRFVLGRLVLAALQRAGWTIDAAPGDPLLCRRGDEAIEVYRDLHEATDDVSKQDAWRERCDRLEIAGLPLASGSAAQRRRGSVPPPQPAASSAA